MSQNTQTGAALKLVKIKSWYIPADTNTYQQLRDIGLPMLKIHKDFIPTLQLATRKAKLRASSQPFDEVLNAYLDKIGSSWKAKPGRNCKLGDNRLVFTAPLTKINRESISKLDVSLSKFFERWAHRYFPTYSTSGERMKLVVDYSFDANRNPVIRSTHSEVKTIQEVELGFTKIRFTFHDKPKPSNAEKPRRVAPPIIQVEVLNKVGTNWVLATTSTCVASQIGDLSQFMAAIGELHRRREESQL